MAKKRMFNIDIVGSDAFLDLPMSCQNLYFHLGMRTDDDGFINNPKMIQRMVGASSDDLKLLIAKKFIIAFESGVVVVKHHLINNNLRADRYKSTQYKDEKSQLYLKENKSYTLDKNQPGVKPLVENECSNSNDSSLGIPNDNQTVTNGCPKSTQPNLTQPNLTQSIIDRDTLTKRLSQTEIKSIKKVYADFDGLIEMIERKGIGDIRKPYAYILAVAEKEHWPTVRDKQRKSKKRQESLAAVASAEAKWENEVQQRLKEFHAKNGKGDT